MKGYTRTVTNLVQQDPPAAVHPPQSGVSELDQQILDASRDKAVRPVEVATALGISTHKVATRMKVLTERGLMERLRNATQNNGPGASTYRAVPCQPSKRFWRR